MSINGDADFGLLTAPGEPPPNVWADRRTSRRRPALRRAFRRATSSFQRLSGTNQLRVVAVVLYLALTITGTTTSSVALLNASTGQGDSGVLIGEPRPIRSDEWLTGTPIVVGFIHEGRNSGTSALSEAPDIVYQTPSGSTAESVVLFDGSLAKLARPLPDDVVFAAYWWLPTLLLIVFLPPWLVRLGATTPLAWLATGLILLAPATAWWSMMPIRLMAFTIAGCHFLFNGIDRWSRGSRWMAAIWCVAAGVMWSRITTYYIPWAILLGPPAFFATLGWGFTTRSYRRATAIATAIGGAAALILLAGLVIENRDAISATLGTVYPGTRSSGGTAVDFGRVLGAPVLQVLEDDPQMITGNQSEVATSYTVCAVWALVVWLSAARRAWTPASTATAVYGGATGLWLSWCLVRWPSVAFHIPAMNRVPPERAAQTVGYLAIILLALVLSRAGWRTPPLRAVAATGVAVASFTAAAGSALAATTIPSLSVWRIVVAAVLAGAVAAGVTRFPTPPAVAVATAVAAAATIGVNPLQHGLGPLRDSPAAAFAAESGESGRLWATDSNFVDALLTSFGVPKLSGNQVTGPIVDQWRALDADGEFETMWNRAVSYVTFTWTEDREPVISNPSPDVIQVSVNPCSLAAAGLNVGHIVSSAPQVRPCLSPAAEFAWNGATQYVYDVVSA